MAYGVEKPASSASCHPFLRSTGLSNPLRYACTRSRVSDRAKQGPMRSQMLLNRLVHTSSGDKNDEGASTFIGSLLPFLFSSYLTILTTLVLAYRSWTRG